MSEQIEPGAASHAAQQRQRASQLAQAVRTELQKAVIGQNTVIDDVLTALIAGGLGLFFPGVAVIGAGYALIVSLAWHTREAAVLAIEQRDGVKFYVVPTPALRPVELVRTPGLRSVPRGSAY